MIVYLDCNATSPLESEVFEIVKYYTDQEFGNAGSRTHEYGTKAKRAIQKAREQVSAVVNADASDVIFTSGATESNNLSILGLLKWAKESGKNHIITTAIEHKAVLEPIMYAESLDFHVTVISPDEPGVVSAAMVLDAIQPDTFLISVMHVNNETGVIQPIDEIADGLDDNQCFFHVDAAQGFGKDFDRLTNTRIDLISISGHKIYGPKGVGALITRRRKFKRAPLSPLMFGGGQERGLRPGTLPVPLIAGLGVAAELCKKNLAKRNEYNLKLRKKLISALGSFEHTLNGNQSLVMPHVLNVSFTGLNSEAIILALKDVVAVSNGSACTSQSYEPSHVLTAMGYDEDRIQSAIRFSWCHMTPKPNWGSFSEQLNILY